MEGFFFRFLSFTMFKLLLDDTTINFHSEG